MEMEDTVCQRGRVDRHGNPESFLREKRGETCCYLTTNARSVCGTCNACNGRERILKGRKDARVQPRYNLHAHLS